jgi:hypothetical protein
MFLGHMALGLAAKRAAPKLSLATLFAAAQFADLLWPFFLAFEIEVVRIAPGITAFTPLDFISYPFSHSLVMLLFWGAFLGLRHRPFLVTSGLVVSHWVLDFVTHRPDMPLYPGGSKFGLGLWNSVPGTVAVELAMYGVGLWAYSSVTRPRDRAGRWGFVTLVGFLLLTYIANIFGGAPPSVPALYLTMIPGSAAILIWSWWADKHREYRRSRGLYARVQVPE